MFLQNQIYWRVVDQLSPRSTAPFDLSSVLTSLTGKTVCEQFQKSCFINIELRDTQVSLKAHFIIVTFATFFFADL